MENLVFAILMLGCDHALDECVYVPTPAEYYSTQAECEDILPLAFHEAEDHPVALGDCIAVPREWMEKDVAFEWSIDTDDRLKVAVVGPQNEVFGEDPSSAVASDKTRRIPAG
ncbi:hypothetical protein [Oricola sp.]|uniref:hypothetical protein n=1 Tax=Oricola sp. TaxID=1979950 RepID=UPI0025F5037A|nr:hypothetical protein [Oricola sp.]MCI5074848.1 hypothetical protein [Oricola sp.]